MSAPAMPTCDSTTNCNEQMKKEESILTCCVSQTLLENGATPTEAQKEQREAYAALGMKEVGDNVMMCAMTESVRESTTDDKFVDARSDQTYETYCTGAIKLISAAAASIYMTAF